MNPIIDLQKQADLKMTKMSSMEEKLLPYYEDKGFRL